MHKHAQCTYLHIVTYLHIHTTHAVSCTYMQYPHIVPYLHCEYTHIHAIIAIYAIHANSDMLLIHAMHTHAIHAHNNTDLKWPYFGN